MVLAATLWIAALDHEELDVKDYCQEIDDLAAELKKSFPADADNAGQGAAEDQEERGQGAGGARGVGDGAAGCCVVA